MIRVQKTLTACLLLVFMTAFCSPASADLDEDELKSLAVLLVERLANGQITEVSAMLDQGMIDAIGAHLEQMSAQWSTDFGQLEKTGAWTVEQSDQYQVLEMDADFEHGNYVLHLAFDPDLKISGFFMRPGRLPVDDAYLLPDNLAELAVTVDAGQGFPLAGLLTMPKESPVLAAVVLIHGSGPNDLDETIGPNKPLRDIAHALAAQGVACLRYNKRTNTYARQISASPDLPKLDIDQEVTWDALAAVELLKRAQGIDPDKIFLLGHSMGGGLLAYLDSLGANCLGYIILAGSSRPLWELSAEQNLLIAQELELSGNLEAAGQIRSYVDQEMLKAGVVGELSDEQALLAEIFGVSAWYWRFFAQMDPAALHLADQKPVLIIQAENDRQVTETDFTLWQQKLADHPNAFFAEFDGLNHLFGAYQGEPVPFSQLVSVEYTQKTPVPAEVTDFIADWIIANLP